MNKETVHTVLNAMMQRHEDAAQKYREAAAMAPDESLTEFLESLAAYRERLHAEIRDFIENMAPSPVTVSQRSRSFLFYHWDRMGDALLSNNRTTISELCNQSEQSIADYYKENLNNNNKIPSQIMSTLEEHHKIILEVTRRTERMETVPSVNKK